ncbi:secreted protein containing Region of unknown function, Spy-related domain protein [Candidatus Omnitrophus magneticus]|uniref:Uncharacterized protein n=1 Tax=Candidatus Omnitrophus magneticus TaxID=1609969 RepID=A0A0F0CNX8_9BACT|nr:secreted protein containing Region of unknown function, Spy-related domain protein [Candidatus Omnitrophus magneticus]
MQKIKSVYFSVIVIFFLGVSLLFSSPLAIAENAKENTANKVPAVLPAQMPPKHTDMMDSLNLTAEQQQKIKAHRTAIRLDMQELYRNLGETQNNLFNEIQKATSDNSVIASLTNQIKDIQAKIVDKRTEDLLGMKSIINAEQFNKFMGFLTNKNGAVMQAPTAPKPIAKKTNLSSGKPVAK